MGQQSGVLDGVSRSSRWIRLHLEVSLYGLSKRVILADPRGAVFLIPYYITIFAFGIPQMILEAGIGQYFRTSLLETYGQVCKKFIGVPITGVLSSLCVATYYIYLMAYCLLYIKVGRVES